MAFLTPNLEFNDRDSRFYLEVKASQVSRDKQEGEVFLFLFHDHLLLSRKAKLVVKISHLKLLKAWPLSAIVVNDYGDQEGLCSL